MTSSNLIFPSCTQTMRRKISNTWRMHHQTQRHIISYALLVKTAIFKRTNYSREQSYLPWENQISNSQTIPWRVFEKPVLTSTIVNKYH
jgi:outer membrane biogenesis lipoprotein LolB